MSENRTYFPDGEPDRLLAASLNLSKIQRVGFAERFRLIRRARANLSKADRFDREPNKKLKIKVVCAWRGRYYGGIGIASGFQ